MRYKKKKGLFLVPILILIIVATILYIKADEKESYIYKTVVVQEGETLWGISLQNNNTDLPIRQYIDELCRINKTRGMIYPGQEIKVLVR